MFRIRLKFPSLASLASNWCLCNQQQNNTRCTFFRSVNSYTDALVSGFDTDPHEHIRHTCWYTTTCIVYIYVKYRIEIMRYIAWSVLRYPENILDIDTDLCRKYRMSMSRILDTIPNTRYRTHKFLKHRCFLYASAYCMTYLVRFILLVSPGIRLNT